MRFVMAMGIALVSVNALAQGTATAQKATPAALRGGAVASATAPKSAYDDAIARARALLKENKTKESLAVSEQAIKMNHQRWEAYVTAASAYSSAQLFEDAVGMLQSALTRAPEDRKPLIRDALAETRRALSAPAPQAAAATPTQAEVVLWKTIENTTKPEDLHAYVKAYPNGTFAPIAAARADKMEWTAIQQSTKPSDFERYLRLFQRGLYASEANSKLDQLDWNAVKSISDSDALKKFIDASTERNSFSFTCKPGIACMEYSNTGGPRGLQLFGSIPFSPNSGMTESVDVYCRTTDCISFLKAVRDAVAAPSRPATADRAPRTSVPEPAKVSRPAVNVEYPLEIQRVVLDKIERILIPIWPENR